MRPKVVTLAVLVTWLGLFLAAPSEVSAQSVSTGAISGQVMDSTGSALPGVTVEASSPALIEQVRTTVTDGQGRYEIVGLRPGTYSVTFALPGFSTFKRSDLALTAGFTAPVNATLSVGSLEETITVSGSSPVVDVSNVRSQNLLSREQLDVIPTAKNFAGFAAMTVGVTGGGAAGGLGGGRDVGGSVGEGWGALSIHGSRGDGSNSVDGLKFQSLVCDGGCRAYATNEMLAQEVVVETGGMSAETETGGVHVNLIPKDGGNRFSGTFTGEYTGRGLQSSNLSDDLRARNLLRANSMRHIYNAGGGLGGPIRRDKAWFYSANRFWGSSEELANVYFNKSPNPLFYERDLDRPGFYAFWYRDSSSRLTWQVASKHKVTALVGYQKSCQCYAGVGATQAPEASIDFDFGPIGTFQGSWTYPVTNRLLVQAGASHMRHSVFNRRVPETGPNDIAVFEESTAMNYGARFIRGGGWSNWLNQYGSTQPNIRTTVAYGSVSYVTGSHTFKVGTSLATGRQTAGGDLGDNPIQYVFNNRTPLSIFQVASPNFYEARVKANLGVYAQDRWTVKRLTVNGGLRFDYFNSYDPGFTRPAGKFLPELTFGPVYNVPNWKDISPRMGLAYDLFGNGRTAVKVSLGRYVVGEGMNTALANNPGETISTAVSRTWNDSLFGAGDPRTGNYVPDCDLTNTGLNGECGALSGNTFGTSVITRRYSADILNGWGTRPYNWQGSVGVQHELMSNVGLTATYFRRWYGNFTTTDNLAFAPSDYDQFCITSPEDARLPNGGGQEVCGFDLKPEKFGQVNNLVTKQSLFGDRSEIYNGVDVNLSARFRNGAILSGGMNTGTTVVENCTVVDSPDLRFCKTSNPQTQVKFAGAIPLWWGVTASATFQNLPGIDQLASYVVTNAAAAPSLGRNLGACRGAATCNATTTVNLVESGTAREPRQTQLDVRLSKSLPLGAARRVRANLDVYNLTNAGDVQGMVTRYGSSWLQPSTILTGRLFKFSAQFDF